MSVLLFAFERRPGGFDVFIRMEHSLSMSSKDACDLGYMDCVVTNISRNAINATKRGGCNAP